MMGKNFRDTLEEQLRDPEFRAEIEALKPKRETGLKAETIKDLFAKFYGEYMREEIDWGKPVGEEISSYQNGNGLSACGVLVCA